MSAMASQITSLTIVYSTVYSVKKKTSKLRATGLCEGNSPVTGEFSAQRASYEEIVSIWWRHHVVGLMWNRCRAACLYNLGTEPLRLVRKVCGVWVGSRCFVMSVKVWFIYQRCGPRYMGLGPVSPMVTTPGRWAMTAAGGTEKNRYHCTVGWKCSYVCVLYVHSSELWTDFIVILCKLLANQPDLGLNRTPVICRQNY